MNRKQATGTSLISVAEAMRLSGLSRYTLKQLMKQRVISWKAYAQVALSQEKLMPDAEPFGRVELMRSKLRMRKILLSFLLPFAAFAQVPAVLPGSVTFDIISHSAARVHWQPTGTGTWNYIRIRWIASPGTCTGGTGGTVQQNMNAQALTQYTSIVAGLSANTTYQVCPEGSADDATWSSGVGGTLTTAPLPPTHPAPPIAPTRFNTDYPDTTGYTVVNVASNDNCSGITNAINNAIPNLKTTGTIINVAAGSVCTGMVHPQPPTKWPDVTQLVPSAFNISNSTITSKAHGLAEGQQIVWSASSGNGQYPGVLPRPPTMTGQSDLAEKQGTIVEGNRYWVHVVDTDHFQVYYGAPYGATCQDERYEGNTCPHLWHFTDQGSGFLQYAPWPRTLKWIIVRTSTPDAQFLPEHVRANPNWAPLMAKMQLANSYLGAAVQIQHTLLSFDGGSGNDGASRYLASNIRFVGMEITYQPYPQAATTADPPPGQWLIFTSRNNSNLIFDRCYIHGYPTPFRVYRMLSWDGANLAFVDSDIRHLNHWRAWRNGLGVHQ